MSHPTLITGASGFLGTQIVSHIKAESISLGRSKSNDIICDLATQIPTIPAVSTVIHNAGKAHSIPKSKEEIQAFYQINYKGTKHLLEGLEGKSLQQFVFISTVAVYGRHQGEDISEDAPLEGETPYALSKIKAEQLLTEWCHARNIPLLILRLPLVYGHNPPGNLGAISKMIRQKSYVQIKGNTARKSMVLADDVAQLIASIKGESGIFNLTDGIHPSFSDLEKALSEVYATRIRMILPKFILQILALGGDLIQAVGLPFPLSTTRLRQMTTTLTFKDSKARQELNWQPRSVIEHAHLIK